MSREFDLVLYGATGFTGRLAARYLGCHAPPGLRWAVAGRHRGRLEALKTGIPVIVASADDRHALKALAARTSVVLSFAGPFPRFGEPMVAACVLAGAHYLDIGGEPGWARTLLDLYDGDARRNQVWLVPAVGFCSTPADLAVDLLDHHLGGGLVESRGYFRVAGGFFNGGTVASEAFRAARTGDQSSLTRSCSVRGSTARYRHSNAILPGSPMIPTSANGSDRRRWGRATPVPCASAQPSEAGTSSIRSIWRSAGGQAW